MRTALVMAGGRSTRMRATKGGAHKGLVPVLGVPLAERVLYSALAHEFSDVVVACSAHEPALGAWFEQRGREVVEGAGASFTMLYENEQQGTIGAAGSLSDRGGPIVVLNVDNLTAIDLSRFVESHEAHGAHLSVASHEHQMQVPYGELVLEGSRIVEYREKPKIPVRVSSGTYVIASDACRLIPRSGRTDVPTLVALILEKGHIVHAFPHSAHWIDVNDVSAAVAANQLVSAHQEEFDLWCPAPHLERGLAINGAAGYITPAPTEPLVAFDDVGSDGVVRYGVFFTNSEAGEVAVDRLVERAVALLPTVK